MAIESIERKECFEALLGGYCCYAMAYKAAVRVERHSSMSRSCDRPFQAQKSSNRDRTSHRDLCSSFSHQQQVVVGASAVG
jgi:hypothetical protein